MGHEQLNRTELLETYVQRRQGRGNEWGNMSDPPSRIGVRGSLVEGALGLLDRLRGDMEVITHGNNRKKQDQDARQRADRKQRTSGRVAGEMPLPP